MAKFKKDLDTKAIATEAIVSRFDYAILETGQRSIVEQKTIEIRERLRRSAQDIWEIGQRLCDVRNTLKHGQFDSWLKAEFGWSRRTAYNFINVYESFSNRANLAEVNIATSALYLLAAPSTPETLRRAVMDEAKKVGGKVVHKDIADRLKPNRAVPTTPITQDVTAATIANGTTETVVAKQEPSKQEIVRVLANPKQFASFKPNRWYQLGDRHHLFTGDTRLPDFAAKLPDIRLAIAITSDDWDHDWLVDIADSLVVLQPDMGKIGTIEQLILMFTKPNDFVLFPWLPTADMLALGDRLGRQVYAGDADSERVQAAAQAAGLAVKLDARP